MALVLADRVQETTTTTGTGTVTLLGAATGYQSFAAVGNTNTTYYCIQGQTSAEWEVGIGTYTSSGTTLSRDTVLSSSAGGTTKVTFSAGTKNVFVTYPAGYAVPASNNPGTSGYILTSNGIGVAPTWQTAPGATITGTTTNATYYIVGTTSTSGSLSTASVSNTNAVSYNASTGALTAVSFSASSDERTKTNWRGVKPDFVERLAEVKHGVFDRIENSNTEVGVSAQSLLNALEQAVITGEDGKLSVNYGGAALVACIQLSKRVLELEAKLNQLSKGNPCQVRTQPT